MEELGLHACSILSRCVVVYDAKYGECTQRAIYRLIWNEVLLPPTYTLAISQDPEDENVLMSLGNQCG